VIIGGDHDGDQTEKVTVAVCPAAAAISILIDGLSWVTVIPSTWTTADA